MKQFKDYPGGARYFDVYTPVFSSLYSQVFWTALKPVDIPQEVIDRYANGGVMAVSRLRSLPLLVLYGTSLTDCL